LLTSGIRPLDKMLGGFELGKIVLLEGDASASRLSHLLAVRAQLPKGKGGLGSTVVWLDGGNSFSVYGISELSRWTGLSPERVLDGIYVSRIFTCYQMSSLVAEKLWAAVRRFRSRFIVISDVPLLYAEAGMPKEEATGAFEPIIENIIHSLNRKDVAVLFTSGSLSDALSTYIRDVIAMNSDILLRTMERRGGVEVRMERHPSRRPARTVIGSNSFGMITLDEFAK
jgi:hypothetical protein